MKKVILGLATIAMVVTSVSALEIAIDAKDMKLAGQSTAKAPEKDSKVNVSGSVIQNSTSVRNSAVAGNTGIQVKGKDVNIQRSHLSNHTSVNNSAVAGNTGIKIKAEKVNVKNSHIHNSSHINNSAVAGNTGVELGN